MATTKHTESRTLLVVQTLLRTQHFATYTKNLCDSTSVTELLFFELLLKSASNFICINNSTNIPLIEGTLLRWMQKSFILLPRTLFTYGFFYRIDSLFPTILTCTKKTTFPTNQTNSKRQNNLYLWPWVTDANLLQHPTLLTACIEDCNDFFKLLSLDYERNAYILMHLPCYHTNTGYRWQNPIRKGEYNANILLSLSCFG